jgi:hypothetical protein
MLGSITSPWRRRATSLLVVLYALCLTAPTAAIALSNGAAPAHCLTDDHHGVGSAQTHENGSSHHHSGARDDGHDQPAKCCGLFCLSAIAPDADLIAAQRAPLTHLASRISNSLSGRGSDRIDRPPRSLLSL